MRIIKNGSTGALNKSSKKSSASRAGAGFSIDSAPGLSEAPASAGMSGVSSVGDIASLLALQGPQGGERRQQAVRQGFETLDALDALKVDVLGGQVSRQKLLQLASLVEEERANLSDPGLMNVLDHIELRARVELAKFEQNAA